jgi:hypothetical protein
MPPGLEVAKRLEARRPFEKSRSADSIERHRNARQASSMRSSPKQSAADDSIRQRGWRSRRTRMSARQRWKMTTVETRQGSRAVWARSAQAVNVSVKQGGPLRGARATHRSSKDCGTRRRRCYADGSVTRRCASRTNGRRDRRRVRQHRTRSSAHCFHRREHRRPDRRYRRALTD